MGRRGQTSHRLGGPSGVGIGLTQGGQCITERLTGGLLPATSLLQGGIGIGLRLRRSGGLGVGLLVSGGELENRGGPSPRTGAPSGSQDVTTACGHDCVEHRRTQGSGCPEILYDPTALEQPVQDPPEAPNLRLRGVHEPSGRQSAVNGDRRCLLGVLRCRAQ